jgi:periplasmic protein TonB
MSPSVLGQKRLHSLAQSLRGYAQASHGVLPLAMLMSLVIHALALLARAGSPPASLRQSGIPLEVELVNARAESAPQKTTLLAQAHLIGGGEHDHGRATTPLPSTKEDRDGALILRLQKRSLQLQQERKNLLRQNQRSYHWDQAKRESARAQTASSSGKDVEQAELARRQLEAEIARDEQLIARRPRRTQITASNATAVSFARYYHKVKRKIERYGTMHFPQAEGRPLYGTLVLVLNVRQDGHLGYEQDGYQIAGIALASSSGNAVLDREAMAIARATAPFGAFTSEMRANYDLLEIIYTFHFTHTGLEAKAVAKP